jgi:hypothetical protein
MEEGLSIGQMFYMIAYENWRPHIPEHCPHGYADLMAACWHEDPEQRPTAQQLLRRLQRLYVQAKQEFLAAKASSDQQEKQTQAPRAAGSSRQRSSQVAAAAAGSSPPGTAGPFTQSPFSASNAINMQAVPVAATAAAVGVGAAEASTAASGTVGGITYSPARQQAQWQQQQQAPQQPCGYPLPQSQMLPAKSVQVGSSVGEGSSVNRAAAPTSSRRSFGGHANTGHHLDSYQPYVQAVLQRAASTSSPLLGWPLSPRFEDASDATAAAAAGAGCPLSHLNAGVLQLPEQQQQQYSAYGGPRAAYGPSGLSGARSSFPQQQEDPAGDDETALFDEDGFASESLLCQLTNPNNVVTQVDYVEQYSGYMFDSESQQQQQQQQQQQEGPLVQPTQEVVELYRQQLQHLQRQAQQQQQ